MYKKVNQERFKLASWIKHSRGKNVTMKFKKTIDILFNMFMKTSSIIIWHLTYFVLS